VRRAPACALLAACLLAACGSDAPDGPAEATVGTGSDAFVPLADGDDVMIVQGPQGGFHVFASVRVRGLEPGNPEDLGDPDNPTTVFQAFEGDARVDLDASTYTQGLDATGEDGLYEMVGRLLILDIQAAAELDGATLRLTVSITDAAGRSAADQRTVTAHAP
jgi:hypothetical protein